jgi:hypothetical protein
VPPLVGISPADHAHGDIWPDLAVVDASVMVSNDIAGHHLIAPPSLDMKP